ncbi:DgyrCDS10298 [Dimorphilus gyrociliatus]|uniref:DgyrCDS10298 n=1 Tax=Dimorphilus gyrociliatus TaxID=2664684 RepID=A0A7I8W0Z3_9ANNE|nr:DgyrCDS10298 [Dimorphilus gyrociliatus]
MASSATERINSTNQARSEKLEETTPIQTRVIPSGKIYRQKFDAEVQLVRSLEKQKSEIRLQSAPSVKLDDREPTFMSNVGTATRRKDKRIPVASSNNKEGMLDKRQLTWATTQSNDDRIENPIFFKFIESNAKEPVSEGEEDVKVVEGLPDVIAPTKTNDLSIIDKISKSRRRRHESILEDMRQQLAIVGNRFEPEITSVSEDLIKKLTENDEYISQVFKKIEDDESLFTCTLEELKLIWRTVHDQSEERKKWICALEAELHEIEDKRTIEAQKILSHHADKLYKISYLLAADLEKYLDADSQLFHESP